MSGSELQQLSLFQLVLFSIYWSFSWKSAARVHRLANRFSSFFFLSETSRFTGGSTPDKNLLVIICSSAGALVLLLVIIVLLVNRHHRQKNAKLVRALGEKT